MVMVALCGVVQPPRLIWLNAETRLSYHCSPSERRAKTTDPGHARGRGNAAAAPTPGHTAQKFGFLLESDPRETLPTFRKKEASFRYETKTRMARKKLRRPSLQQPGTKGLRAKPNLKTIRDSRFSTAGTSTRTGTSRRRRRRRRRRRVGSRRPSLQQPGSGVKKAKPALNQT